MSRPFKLQDVDDFERRVSVIIEECEREGRLLTVARLCREFGFASKNAWYEQSKRGGKWEDVCARVKWITEEQLVHAAVHESKKGAEFLLKVTNHDYRDVQRVETVSIPVQIDSDDAKA